MVERNRGLVNDRLILYSSGSNSHGQTGLQRDGEDLHEFEKSYEWRSEEYLDENAGSHKPRIQGTELSTCTSIGGRHSLFLINYSIDQNPTKTTFCSSLYGCGDHLQGQLGISSEDLLTAGSAGSDDFKKLKTSLSVGPGSQNIDNLISQGKEPSNDTRLSSMIKIDYKALIFKISNIDNALKDLLSESYQPIQVLACWETSFIVLTHSSNLQQLDRTAGNLKLENLLEASRQIKYHDDHIIAFGSDNFDLRGSRDLLVDQSNPNLVDLPKPEHSAYSGRRIRLHGGCKHVIAMIKFNTGERSPSIHLIGWGAARHGQLGSVDAHSKLPRSIKPTLLPISIPASLDFTSIKIALGNQHTVIISPTRIWCWGTNRHSQLPAELQNIEPGKVLELQASWNATFVLTQASKPGHKLLLGYGSNAQGQLGVEDYTASKVERLVESSYSRLSAGSEHVLITKGDHQVWGWGWNEHGNLAKTPGIQLQESRLFGLILCLPTDQYITEVAAGCATSIIICRNR